MTSMLPPVSRRDFLALSAALAVIARPPATPAQAGARTACVLGATGHVGGLVVRQLLSGGWRVVAISRSAEKLATLTRTYAGAGHLAVLQGDVGTDAQAADLRTRFLAAFGHPQAVVASLSSPAVDGRMRVLDSPTDALRTAFEDNFFTHVTAAKGLIPALPGEGVYLGINGGLANFASAGMAQLSMTQSAIRSLYEVLALETHDPKQTAEAHPAVRLLELYGLVDDGGGEPIPPPMRIDGAELSRRVADIVSHPDASPGPILTIKSKAFS